MMRITAAALLSLTLFPISTINWVSLKIKIVSQFHIATKSSHWMVVGRESHCAEATPVSDADVIGSLSGYSPIPRFQIVTITKLLCWYQAFSTTDTTIWVFFFFFLNGHAKPFTPRYATLIWRVSVVDVFFFFLPGVVTVSEKRHCGCENWPLW